MAELEKVIARAWSSYHDLNSKFPSYALTSWEDRKRWTDYLLMIGKELDNAIQSQIKSN